MGYMAAEPTPGEDHQAHELVIHDHMWVIAKELALREFRSVSDLFEWLLVKEIRANHQDLTYCPSLEDLLMIEMKEWQSKEDLGTSESPSSRASRAKAND